MERWSEEEDSFSVVHTVPNSFSMRNGDGPDRVEIFDIISIPSHHSTISETACLCDIFGDDCDTPTLSCSPASGSLTKEVDDFSLADDTNNDSSGSYHTALCSEQLSDSSENYEDSKETLSPSPPETSLSSNPIPAESDNVSYFLDHRGSSRISENGEFSPQCTSSAFLSDNNVTKHPFELREMNYNPEDTTTFPSPGSTSPSFSHHSLSHSLEPRPASGSCKPETKSPSPSLSTTSESKVKLPPLESRVTSTLTKPRVASNSPIPGALCSLPQPEGTSPSPKSRARPPSPKLSVTSSQTTYEGSVFSLESKARSSSPKFTNTSPLNKIEGTSLTPKSESRSPSPKPRDTSPTARFEGTSPTLISVPRVPSPKPRATFPMTNCESTSLSPRFRPGSLSPICRTTTPSPKPEASSSSLKPKVRASSPKPEDTSPSPKSEVRSPSPKPRSAHPSTKPQGSSPSPKHESRSPSPKHTSTSPSTKPKDSSSSLKAKVRASSPKPEDTSPSPKSEVRSPSPKPRSAHPSTKPQGSSPSPKHKTRSPSPKHRSTSPSAKPIDSSSSLKPKVRASSPKPEDTSPSPKSGDRSLSPKPRSAHLSPKPQGSSLSPKAKTRSPSPKHRATPPSVLCTRSTLTLSPHARATSPSAESGNNTSNTDLWAECKTFPKHKVNTPQDLYAPNAALTCPSGSQENLHKEIYCSPEQHETGVSTKLANIFQQPNKIVTSAGSPCASLSNRKSISRECNNQQCRDGEREEGVVSGGEDQWGEEGEGKWGVASYREEQVELSFSARNRKVPANHSVTATYRQPLSGMTARCYSECLLATQQLQHQNSVKPQGSEDEHQVCSRKSKLIPRTLNSGFSSIAPDYSSENSSMGSELDETDNEVKWFTDLAFKSLSSPQVDYLDVYNSSHRSSTNVSQQSTEDITGVNAWSAYADLRGSTRHENDDPSRHAPSLLPLSRLDRAKRFEMGSFECVDVALESRDETRRGKRTVPKRQIQLKRRDTSESRASENSEVTSETAPTTRHSKDILLRQHSTPAAMQEETFQPKCNVGSSDRKQKLQKSLSLDETSGKTKMATCFIKSVLSRKMQHETKFTNQQVPVQNGKVSPSVTMEKSSGTSQSPPFKQSSKTELSSISSGFPSDCSLSSEDLQRAEPNLPSDSNKQHGSFSSSTHQRSSHKSSLSPLPSGSVGSDSQSSISARSGIRSELLIPFESMKKEKQSPREEGQKLVKSDPWEKNSSDSANTSTGNTSAAATRIPSMRSGMTNRKDERRVKPANHKQTTRNIFLSKTPEITLKACVAGEKEKASRLTPDLEIMPAENPETLIPRKTEKQGETVDNKSEDEAEKWVDNDTNKKGLMVKVRDVRKLVKNTYNLSFKATAPSTEDRVSPGREKKLTPPMQTESKAIGKKDDKVVGSAAAENEKVDKVLVSDVTLKPQAPQEKVTEIASLCFTPKNALTEEVSMLESNIKTSDGQTCAVSTLTEAESNSLAENAQMGAERLSKVKSLPKFPNKEREISTLILLQDGQTNDGQDPSAPPPLSLTTTSSSRSVSMLLKEKGFQADIGLCDIPNDKKNTITKHVNRIEVPLQSCSVEENVSGQQKGAALHSVTTPERAASPQPSPFVEIKDGLHQEDPTVSRTVELENASLESPEKETQAAACNTQKTTVSETSRYRQQESITEETRTTSYVQKSTMLATSANMHQPAITATFSYQHSPGIPDSPEKSKILSPSEQPSTSSSKQSTVSTTQEPSYAKQAAQTAPFRNLRHSDKPHFYASDDPPSYDERESFSPLLLTDLPARRPRRYHPTSHDPPCSSTSESTLTPAHPSPRPFGLALPPSPPVRTLDPSYPLALPLSRQSQHRSDAQSLSSQPPSPQTSQPSDPQAPIMFHPLQPTPAVPSCPGHLLQPCPEDSKQPPPSLRGDRRTAHQRPPPLATQLVGSGPYSHHGHSPSVPSLEARPQYLCSPQGFATSYSPEYGSESTGSGGVLYPESGSGVAYGQNPRRVLLDPETGKYFYIEMPVQPLRKMLFDPETGQYVEVLIPHQTISHSGLFPPSAVPYPSLHSPSMYTPQYLPYSAPRHPATQPTRHPEGPPPPGLHQNEAGFGSSETQSPKPEVQSHAPLDQSYLESMYYIPTGMTASPNPTSPDFYHKLPPGLPNSGAKRS